MLKKERNRTTEDYLRVIWEIQNASKPVVIKTIAKKLKIKPPSVVEKLRKLEQSGLMIYDKKNIDLTQKGKEIAEKVVRKYNISFTLLKLLSLPDDIAFKDAHVMEHELHEETLRQLKLLIDFLKSSNYRTETKKTIN